MNKKLSQTYNNDTVSVSKGVFVCRKNFFGSKTNKVTHRAIKINHRTSHKNEKWYKTFHKTWSAIQYNVSKVNKNTFKQILTDLENFVQKVKDLSLLPDEIPTGILLAGVNLPDHDSLLYKLTDRLSTVTPYISTVWSRDAVTLKNFTEEVIYQFINRSLDESFSEIKRCNCTFQVLQAWHKENVNRETPLVLIIPDFEGFSSKILHDFILILSSHCQTIKFVLIFGVATSLHIVHHSLSYDATSKLKVEVFHTQTQKIILSDILESIVLTSTIPFKLTGRAFNLLVDIFLFYDFSVNSFLQSYKLCMWKHFYRANEKSICCDKENAVNQIESLDKNDIKCLEKLESVKNYLKENKICTSESGLKKLICQLVEEFHEYENHFLIILKCLHKLVVDIPQKPFGKEFRELYASAVGHENFCETEQFKETIKMVDFFSREELIEKIICMISIINKHESSLNEVVVELKAHLCKIQNASLERVVEESSECVSMSKNKNRHQFLQTLKSSAVKSQSSPYMEARINFFDYLNQMFTKYLKSPHQKPLHEIFCYNEANTVTINLRGSMKALIYKSLTNPHYIFGCRCCQSNEDNILSTYPDLCIIFKLHLESRKMINLYDWLTSFIAVLNPQNSNENDIPPLLHARFTQSVAELQFLGFIKATRLKTDHVVKLM